MPHNEYPWSKAEVHRCLLDGPDRRRWHRVREAERVRYNLPEGVPPKYKLCRAGAVLGPNFRVADSSLGITRIHFSGRHRAQWGTGW